MFNNLETELYIVRFTHDLKTYEVVAGSIDYDHPYFVNVGDLKLDYNVNLLKHKDAITQSAEGGQNDVISTTADKSEVQKENTAKKEELGSIHDFNGVDEIMVPLQHIKLITKYATTEFSHSHLNIVKDDNHTYFDDTLILFPTLNNQHPTKPD